MKIADKTFNSRLFLGTGKYAHSKQLVSAVVASETELVTMAVARVSDTVATNTLYRTLNDMPSGIQIDFLPNTSGARNAKEAIYAAELARQIFGTYWVKLEIHPERKYLLPDPLETVKAAEHLVKKGFVVLPYCSCDPMLCRRLQDVGCDAVMPLASPIGSLGGISSTAMLQIIIEQAQVPVIVDAGLGAPSHATQAMEMGADAVLVNTAIAVASEPDKMASAFKQGVQAGRTAYELRLTPQSEEASATTPMTDFLREES